MPEDPESDPSLSDSLLRKSYLSDESDYKRKICDKNKNNWKLKKQEPIKLCAKLAAKFLTTAYKVNTIKLKFYEDPLKHRIYFLTFIYSLEMIFSY